MAMATAINWKCAAVITACLLAACGGGTDLTKAQVRMVNASAGYAQLDLRVDDQLRQGAVGYGAAEGYVEVSPGKAASTISSPSSATTLLSFTPSLSEKKYYTLLAYGPAGALQYQQLDENMGAPDTGRALLRVVNAASDAGALDVYLSGPTDDLSNVVPVQTGVAYNSAGSVATINSGTWRLRATAAGSKTDVRLDVPAVSLPSKQVATLVLTPSAGGILVNALVLVQQGSITRQDTALARVRLAAAVADSGVVGARVGSTNLVTILGSGAVSASPSLDDYVLVPVGTSAPTVTVNGQALSLPAKTLDPGRDYTFLVHGLATAPLASWVDDDNRLPSNIALVKLRLINALADTALPLAMTVDGRPVAGAVGVGTASAYTLVPPVAAGGTSGRLSVTATGVATPVYTSPSQTLTASGSYSVLVTGRQASVAGATGIVRQDR